jgi:hypothetical protein
MSNQVDSHSIISLTSENGLFHSESSHLCTNPILGYCCSLCHKWNILGLWLVNILSMDNDRCSYSYACASQFGYVLDWFIIGWRSSSSVNSLFHRNKHSSLFSSILFTMKRTLLSIELFISTWHWNVVHELKSMKLFNHMWISINTTTFRMNLSRSPRFFALKRDIEPRTIRSIEHLSFSLYDMLRISL